MSIATEIARVQSDKIKIRNKMVELGLSQSNDGLDKLAADVESIENQGAVSATVQEGDTYTIPKGYHNGSGTVSGVSGGGSYGLQSKTVTPTKKQQNVTPDSGYYGMSDVTVEAIPEAYQDVSGVTADPADVLAGKMIVGPDGELKPGEMPNNGAIVRVLDAITKETTIPEGYHNGEGVVRIVTEDKEVTPSDEEQVIEPAVGKVLGTVTVGAIPEEYVKTDDADAEAADILDGKTAYVDGVKVTGTMPSNPEINMSIDGLSVTAVDIPAGYTPGGTVSLTDDIENMLAEI